MVEYIEKESNFNIFEKIFYSIFKPEMFFEKIKSENFSSTFFYLLFISSITLSLQIILFYIGIKFNPNDNIIKFFENFVGTISLSFLATGVFHVFAKIFGGKSNYRGTYQAYVYGFTVTNFLVWVPYIGSISVIYGVYVFIKGISTIHEISAGKAFLSWFTPILIITIILLVLFLIVGVAIFSYIAGIYYANPEMLNSLETTGNFLKTIL
ncbi:MAG: Yip1 family protein [Candidatus Aenigmatarchaeota archaeon]